MKRANRTFVVFLLLAVVSQAPAQRGGIVVQMNLAEMVDESGIIVHGYVIRTQVEKHPQFKNLNTAVITVRVAESLKGSVGETYTFRQYIWDVRDMRDAAGYRKGQEVLLLLLTPNEHGLSSTSGEEQGRFRIQRDGKGTVLATNGYGNLNLFDTVPARIRAKGAQVRFQALQMAAEHERGPVPLDDLRDLVRGLVRSSR